MTFSLVFFLWAVRIKVYSQVTNQNHITKVFELTKEWNATDKQKHKRKGKQKGGSNYFQIGFIRENKF